MNIGNNIRNITVIATTCFALASPMLASAAIKTSQVAVDKIVISYDASEMNQPGGLARVERAVRKAAEKICGADSYGKTKSLQDLSASKTCFNDAVDNALQGVHEMQVSSR